MSEIQSICEDLLPACVLSTTFPTVPGSGMVLAAFATHGYVLDGQNLIYVEQPAVSVTLTGSAGNYWLALHRDVSSAVAGWTRRPGSHYLWQTNATQPANPAGALVFCQVVVTGANITAVTPLAGARNPMSKQMSSAVAITGGSAALNDPAIGAGNAFALSVHPGGAYVNALAVGVQPGAMPQGALHVGQNLHVANGVMGIQAAAAPGTMLYMLHKKTTGPAFPIIVRAAESDVSGNVLSLMNVAGTVVGSIAYTGTATAYNTSSDARLKHAVAALDGALARVQALRPVRFRWNADDSADEGFLAHELQQVLPRAVSGEPDAVNEDGSVKPQQVDHAKIVPWLVGALQETLAQVQALATRVQSLEEQLGI